FGSFTGGLLDVDGELTVGFAGAVNNAEWDVGSARVLRAARQADSSVFRSAGNVQQAAFGTFQDSSLLLALPDTATDLPTDASAFQDQAVLGRLIVASRQPGAFAGSRVAAPEIGQAVLGQVEPDNQGMTFGVATDSVNRLLWFENGWQAVRNEDGPQTIDDDGDDFVIRIF
ncbi:MAG: hypothetical protein ACOC93_01740, partial [Planctomycetota bacterium]